jgi:hypothetical protein
MRDPIAIQEIRQEILAFVFNTKPSISYHSHSRIFKDVDVGTTQPAPVHVYEANDVCPNFGRMSNRPLPLSKHIGVPYHWLRSQVENLFYNESILTINWPTNSRKVSQLSHFALLKGNGWAYGDNYRRRGVLQYLLYGSYHDLMKAL